MTKPRGRSSFSCDTVSAAPSEVPLSPAAGWMKTSVNGVRSRILPAATLFIMQPPAMHSCGIRVRDQRSASTWKTASSNNRCSEAAMSR